MALKQKNKTTKKANQVWDKMIPPCSGVCKISCWSPVDCDPPASLPWCSGSNGLQDTEIPEIILVLLTAGMYSMCYSSSTREVERVLNISRSPQDYILWRRRPALTLHVGLQVVTFQTQTCLNSLLLLLLLLLYFGQITILSVKGWPKLLQFILHERVHQMLWSIANLI